MFYGVYFLEENQIRNNSALHYTIKSTASVMVIFR
jgi:hypothetical protein